MALYYYAVKMSKMAKIWGFVPYSEPKKSKKWRISAGLRAKNGRWGGKNTQKSPGVGYYS